MILRPRSIVAAAYVNDIDAARAFYRLLGLVKHSSGKAEASAWAVMQHGGCRCCWPRPGRRWTSRRLPLLFYFFYDDVEAVVGVLEQAGVPVIRTGHPPHALGGEVKVLDPDGNTVPGLCTGPASGLSGVKDKHGISMIMSADRACGGSPPGRLNPTIAVAYGGARCSECDGCATRIESVRAHR
jgi:predicted enzyme related to lactoylglutathione lyase